MWLQRLTNYLLRHRWQAIVLTFLITYIPIIGMASILIAAFMTLCVGIVEGAIFTIAATLPYAFVFVSGTSQEAVAIVTWATVILSVAGNVLTWALAVMLRRNYSWSVILQISALLGVLVISVFHLVNPDIADWWGMQLQSFYNQSTAMAGIQGNQLAQTGANQTETINGVKHFATGIIVAFVLFNAVIQVIVARWWQAVMFSPGSLRKELHNIRLSQLAGILFVISLVFYYLENSVVLDILPILCLLFSAAGLSLVHSLCGLLEPNMGRFWLSLLYIALLYSLIMLALLPLFSVMNWMLPVVLAVMIMAISILVFASLGLFDIWFDMRKRFRRV